MSHLAAFSETRAMPEPRTFTGGCHCGLVRYECTSDLAMVTDCNCSICTKKGLHITFVDPKSFRLAAGEDALKEYKFNRHVIAHQMCSECAVCARPEAGRHERDRRQRRDHRRHRAFVNQDDAVRWQEALSWSFRGTRKSA
jgi:hypothetical protein